jgi:hypothetical protein
MASHSGSNVRLGLLLDEEEGVGISKNCVVRSRAPCETLVRSRLVAQEAKRNVPV